MKKPQDMIVAGKGGFRIRFSGEKGLDGGKRSSVTAGLLFPLLLFKLSSEFVHLFAPGLGGLGVIHVLLGLGRDAFFLDKLVEAPDGLIQRLPVFDIYCNQKITPLFEWVERNIDFGRTKVKFVGSFICSRF